MKKFKDIIKSKTLLSIIMSVITYISLINLGVLPAYNLFSWLIFFIITNLFLKTNIFNKILKKEIIILTILFSLLGIYGTVTYSILDSKELGLFYELLTLKNLLNTIGTFNIIFILLTNIVPKIDKYNIKNKKNIINKKWLIFLISFLCIFLCWLPYFLTFFPGTISPDSLSELTMVIENFTKMSDHHPILHVLFIGIPYKIGYALLGTANGGVAFSTLTQMICMASIFSSFILFLYNRKTSDIILLITLLFYSILPMHGYFSIVMWKDVMFAGMLLLLTMQLIKILEKEKNSELSFCSLIPFIIVSILCVFFRNNAIYMYVILAAFMLVVLKKYYKLLLLSFFIVFASYLLVKGPIFNALEIKKSSSAEYIAMPLQQIGRMAYKGVDFTNKEIKIINDLIPVNIMASVYNPRVVDGIKFNENYKIENFDKNKGDYFKLWFNLVKKYPAIAIESYSASTLGYWYPGVEYWSVSDYIVWNEYDIHMEPKFPKQLETVVRGIASKNIPILNMEWSIGLYFWIILIFLTISIKKNKIRGVLPYMPTIGIWITMMIASPVFGEFRYIYCVVCCLPLLMITPYFILKKR